MDRWQRTWVAAVTGLVALTGFGILPDLWPFVSWGMFSSPARDVSDYLVVVAVHEDGTRTVHRDERLPGGYLREGYLHRFEQAGQDQRRRECARMLDDLRSRDATVEHVELERWRWDLLDRVGTGPAEVERTRLGGCA
jgi:hypothetical protein